MPKVQTERKNRLVAFQKTGVKVLIESEEKLIAFGEKVMEAMNGEPEQPKQDLDNAWPTKDVIKRLIAGCEYLLNVGNYDGHGYEELKICVDRAKEILKEPEQPSEGRHDDEVYKSSGKTCLICNEVIDNWAGDPSKWIQTFEKFYHRACIDSIYRKGSWPSVDGELLEALKVVVREYDFGEYNNHLGLESINAFDTVFRRVIARAEGGSESKK